MAALIAAVRSEASRSFAAVPRHPVNSKAPIAGRSSLIDFIRSSRFLEGMQP